MFKNIIYLCRCKTIEMERTQTLADTPVQKGNILVINTGSTTTKLGFYSDGTRIFDTKLEHTADEVAKYPSVMDQTDMRRLAIEDFLKEKNIPLESIDIIMARGGLFTPVITGVYNVNKDMRDVLISCRDGVHACNLSAVLADDIAKEVNEARDAKGITNSRHGKCIAYVADPPMADEMLPECRMGGIPEFTRKTLFHALNSRAIVRRYLREHGHKTNDVTVIVAHY